MNTVSSWFFRCLTTSVFWLFFFVVVVVGFIFTPRVHLLMNRKRLIFDQDRLSGTCTP